MRLKMKEYLIKSSLENKNLGERMAKRILKSSLSRAVVIGLIGDLGGGKTTFLQGFAKGLGTKEKILSPTFVIMKKFSIFNSPFSNFYHFDCYRIEKPKEILELGFKEIISNPKNIICIEWADRIRNMLPLNSLFLIFKMIDEKTRKIIIKNKL